MSLRHCGPPPTPALAATTIAAYSAAAAVANVGSPHTCFATNTPSSNRSCSNEHAAGCDGVDAAATTVGGADADIDADTDANSSAASSVATLSSAPPASASAAAAKALDREGFIIASLMVARVNHRATVGVTLSGSRYSSGLECAVAAGSTTNVPAQSQHHRQRAYVSDYKRV